MNAIGVRISDIDRGVGQKIRERRTLLGMTQQQLADLIGVTYQQAHKYERGINRISAGRLFEIARVLNVGVDYFYQDLPGLGGKGLEERQRLCLDVARNFARIRNDRSREAISQLCRAVADEEEDLYEARDKISAAE